MAINDGNTGNSIRNTLNKVITHTVDDVAGLIADTTLTYVSNRPGSVVAGDRITTRNGHSFDVAASNAVNHHITNAHGTPVKLYEAGFRFTTLDRLKAAVARGDSYSAGDTVLVAGAVYSFLEDGNTDTEGLTGWGVGGIARVADRTALKALWTGQKVCYLLEAEREGLYQWDALIDVNEHVADTDEQRLVAPDAAADGAWVKRAGGSPFYVNAPDVTNLNPSLAGRGRRIERVWQLPDPTVAANYDQEVILVGQPPIRAWCDGLQWWDLGAQTVIDPWWLPKDALAFVDFANSRFYWDGAVKALSDLTDNEDGSYILIPSTALDFSSGEQIIIYDRTLDMDAGERSGTLWQVREGTGNSQTLRAEPPNISQSLERLIGNYYATSGQVINPSMTSIAGETSTFPNTGRHRQLLRLKNGEQIRHQPDNGEYREVGPAELRVVTTIPDIERIMLGCSWSIGDAAPASPAVGATLNMFAIYNRDFTEAEREAVGRTGLAAPAHILGDSFMTLYRPQHNISKLIEDDTGGYWALSQDAIGGTSLAQQFIRYRDNAAKFRRSTLVIGEMGASFMMPDALKDILAIIESDRWLILEPAPNKAQIIGAAGRAEWDRRRDELRAVCGPNWVPTLALALAESDGSAGDLADVANGIWPRSLTKSDTDFHPSALGDDFLAKVIVSAHVVRGWLPGVADPFA